MATQLAVEQGTENNRKLVAQIPGYGTKQRPVSDKSTKGKEDLMVSIEKADDEPTGTSQVLNTFR